MGKVSGSDATWAIPRRVLISTSLDCPDPWVSAGGNRDLSRKASFSRGSGMARGTSRGRGRGGKKGAAKPRSKTGAFRAADD